MNFLRDPRRDKTAAKLKTGTRVYFHDPGLSGKLGIVVSHQTAYRPFYTRNEVLYHVRFYDSVTGLPQTCPRCDGTDPACPIHGRNFWADAIYEIPAADLVALKQEGLIRDGEEETAAKQT